MQYSKTASLTEGIYVIPFKGPLRVMVILFAKKVRGVICLSLLSKCVCGVGGWVYV